MAYNPSTDFLALLRQTSGGIRVESMPGLDYVLSAMARAQLFNLWVNPTSPPTVNPAPTVWLKASSVSYATEGSVFLYNADTGNFQPANPQLWRAVFAAAAAVSVFQSVTGNSANIGILTTLLAIERDNPGMTTLALPSVVGRTLPLQIVDWSTNIAAHRIVINPSIGETIMRRATWSLYSTVDQLGGMTLYPSADLVGWVIAP